MNHYTDPAGRLWSRRELTALVKGWRVPKPLPRIQTYGAVDVVREDERELGTKSRLLDALMSATDAREFVFGSASSTGLGAVALADACRLTTLAPNAARLRQIFDRDSGPAADPVWRPRCS